MKVIKDRRVLYALVFLMIVIFGVLIYFAVTRDRQRQEEITKKKVEEKVITREIQVGGKTLTVEVASSRHKKAKGLRQRESMDENYGMLFLFGTEGLYTFWTKDMKFPLDIIWANQDLEIVYIEKNVPPCQSEPCDNYTPTEFAKYSVEVNGGWVDKNGIAVGDTIIIDQETKEEAETADN